MMKFGIFSIDLKQTFNKSKSTENIFTKFLSNDNKSKKNELEYFIKYIAKLLEFDEGNVAAI